MRQDVAGRIGPADRDEDRRGLLQAAQVLAHGFRRAVAARFGVAPNKFGLAHRALDRLEGACGVLRQDLREAARGLLRGRDRSVIARVEVDDQHRAATDDDRGGEAEQHVVRPARQIFADRPRQRFDPAHAHRRFPPGCRCAASDALMVSDRCLLRRVPGRSVR